MRVPQFIIATFFSVCVAFSAWCAAQLLDVRERMTVIETKLGIARHSLK